MRHEARSGVDHPLTVETADRSRSNARKGASERAAKAFRESVSPRERPVTMEELGLELIVLALQLEG